MPIRQRPEIDSAPLTDYLSVYVCSPGAACHQLPLLQACCRRHGQWGMIYGRKSRAVNDTGSVFIELLSLEEALPKLVWNVRVGSNTCKTEKNALSSRNLEVLIFLLFSSRHPVLQCNTYFRIIFGGGYFPKDNSKSENSDCCKEETKDSHFYHLDLKNNSYIRAFCFL